MAGTSGNHNFFVLREALIVIGGAVIAAIVLSKIPALKAFIQKNTSGCDCANH